MLDRRTDLFGSAAIVECLSRSAGAREYQTALDVVRRAEESGAAERPAPRDQGQYQGEWRDGQMHGLGRLVRPDGSCYAGQFEKDRPHGYGKIVMGDGAQVLLQ